MDELQDIQDESLFSIVKTIIKGKIEGGYLKPYERIPSELELSSILGISRQTIRRALDELVHTGILYRVPRTGTYVSPPLSALNRVSGHTIISTRSDNHEFITLDKKITEPPQFASKLLSKGKEEKVVTLKQLIKVKNTNRFVQESYLPLKGGNKILDLKDDQIPLLEILMKHCKFTPYSTKETLELVTADSYIYEALELSSSSLVPCLSGFILSPDGHPFEAHRVFFHPEFFKLEFSFTFE